MVQGHWFTRIASPLGELLATSDGKALTGLFPPSHRDAPRITSAWCRDDGFFTGVRDQLDAYFAGRLRAFEIPLSFEGSPFQQAVWFAVQRIPFGTTWTYGELATSIGAPRALRAVGLAIGRNPISVVVPCHRVLGGRNQLTGYSTGIERKRWLLDHEAGVLLGVAPRFVEPLELTDAHGAIMRVHAPAANA